MFPDFLLQKCISKTYCTSLLLLIILCGDLSARQSLPVFPDTTWLKFAAPEEAGWSSEGIDRARAFADSLGSRAVMLIYDGAIVAEWGYTQDIAPVASIRKSLFSALREILYRLLDARTEDAPDQPDLVPVTR